jgi:hypothetical protein
MKVFNYSVRVLNGKNNPAEETAEGYVPLEHGDPYTLLLRNFSDKDALASISIDGKEIACVKVPAKDKVKVDGPFDSDQKFTFYKKDSEEGQELEFDKVESEELGVIEVKFIDAGTTQMKQINTGSMIYYVPVYYYDWYWPYWMNRGWTVIPFINNTTIASTAFTVANNIPYTTSTNNVVFRNGSSISYKSGGSEFKSSTASNQGYSASINLCATSSGMSSGGTGLSGLAEFTPLETEKLQPEFEKLFDAEDATTIFLRLVGKEKDYKSKPVKMVGFSNKKPAALE